MNNQLLNWEGIRKTWDDPIKMEMAMKAMATDCKGSFPRVAALFAISAKPG